MRNDVGSYYYDEFSNYISSAVLIDNMDIVLVGFIDSGTKISISITPSIPGNNSVNNAYRYSENGFNLDTSGYVSNKWGNNISIDSSYKPQIFGYSPTYLPSATYLQPGIPSLSAINFYQLNAGPVANSTTDTSGMFVTNANLFNSNLSNGFGITLTKYTSAVSGL